MNYAGRELGLFALATGWKRYVRSRLSAYVGPRVLEVGAGLGGTTRALAGQGEASWTCLEPDAGQCSSISTMVERGELPPHCKVLCGTVIDLPREAAFETVLYVDVLEHIEDDAAELERAASHLVKGGYLAVLSPAHQWLFSEFDKSVGHRRRYSRAGLEAAGPLGCTLVHSEYLDSAGLALSLANRLFLRQPMPTERQILFWDRCVVPVSRIFDPLFFQSLGKSVLCVWQRGGGGT